MTRLQLYKIIFLASWWILSSIFIVMYEATTLGFKSAIEGIDYDFTSVFSIVLIVTVVAASFIAAFEVLWFDRFFRKKSFGRVILIKSSFYLCCILVFVSLAIFSIISESLQQSMFSAAVTDLYIKEYIADGKFFMTMVYWALSISMGLFILQVSDKFGPGVLWEFLKGKYHTPKEEERIFMFMDLKSSTVYGEKLGHIKYSQLIQECYYDLTEVVSKYEARIYQYVGDEVVMTWNVGSPTENLKSIKTYFEYDKLIHAKSKFYKDRFDAVPEFKASLHIGKVTAAEVGELKKELAYHGDVLNTAARIQGKCNEFDSKLLISEEMKNALGDSQDFIFSHVGDVILKGKERPVNIYKVESG